MHESWECRDGDSFRSQTTRLCIESTCHELFQVKGQPLPDVDHVAKLVLASLFRRRTFTTGIDSRDDVVTTSMRGNERGGPRSAACVSPLHPGTD